MVISLDNIFRKPHFSEILGREVCVAIAARKEHLVCLYYFSKL